MKDIVIAAGTAVGSVLELARSIKKEVDCKSYVLCTSRKTAEIIQSSKFIDEVIFIDGSTEINYIEAIKSWCQSKEFKTKPILYFTTDTSCFYVDNDREWFEQRFELCLPSSNIIKTYTQKGLAEVNASEAGLAVPKTLIIDDTGDIERVIERFSFPVILKPRATYLKNNIDFKIKVLHNKTELLSFANNLIEKGNTILCQEFIPGGNDSSYYYLFYRTTNGEVFTNIGRKTFQSSKDGGIMAKGLVEYNDEIASLCKNFLNTIDYIGIGGIEFKKYNGIYYFIEMSTRLEGFFKIAEVSNSPLSKISYYDLSNNDLKVSELTNCNQRDGIVYMDFIVTLVTRINSKNLFALISDLFSSVFNSKVKLNIYSKEDLKPFWLVLKRKIIR